MARVAVLVPHEQVLPDILRGFKYLAALNHPSRGCTRERSLVGIGPHVEEFGHFLLVVLAQ